MAKKSKIAKELKREKLVNQYYELRKELKEKGDYKALKIAKRFISNSFNKKMQSYRTPKRCNEKI